MTQSWDVPLPENIFWCLDDVTFANVIVLIGVYIKIATVLIEISLVWTQHCKFGLSIKVY